MIGILVAARWLRRLPALDVEGTALTATRGTGDAGEKVPVDATR